LPSLPDLSTPSLTLNSVVHNAISTQPQLNAHLILIPSLINVHSVEFKFIAGLMVLSFLALAFYIISFIFESIKDLIPVIKSYMYKPHGRIRYGLPGETGRVLLTQDGKLGVDSFGRVLFLAGSGDGGDEGNGGNNP
jgi:hypothetical protein